MPRGRGGRRGVAPFKWNIAQIRRRKQRVEISDGFVGFDDGLEGRRDLLVGEEVPVDRFEKGVFLEFGRVPFCAESVLGVSVEQLSPDVSVGP